VNSFPQQISPSGRYFLDAQGSPFLWLGDTAWPLFTQYSLREAEAYLEDRAKKGFTVVQGVLAWFGGDRPDPSGISPNWKGEYPWLDKDPARPNPAFFEHVDDLLSFAQNVGLTLAILPTWGNLVTDLHLFSVEKARQYGTWLGRRYKDQPNIIWINGGDCLPHGFEDIFDALGEGLKVGDAGRHLITYHPCALHSSSQYFNDREWLDFHMIQTWTDWHKTYESVLTDSLMIPTRPVVLGEGAYENGPEYPRGPITPLIVRRQAWWAFMAGGYYTFGQNMLWRVDPGWIQTFHTPGAEQMGVFKQIVSAIPWWQRLPDQSIVEEGASGGETLNAAVRSVDGQWMLVYLSSRCHVLVRLEKLASPKARATWFNPASGEKKDAGEFATYTLPGFRQVRATLYQWFATPEHWEDALLLLEGCE
jgi:hypothetical protein